MAFSIQIQGFSRLTVLERYSKDTRKPDYEDRHARSNQATAFLQQRYQRALQECPFLTARYTHFTPICFSRVAPPLEACTR